MMTDELILAIHKIHADTHLLVDMVRKPDSAIPAMREVLETIYIGALDVRLKLGPLNG